MGPRALLALHGVAHQEALGVEDPLPVLVHGQAELAGLAHPEGARERVEQVRERRHQLVGELGRLPIQPGAVALVVQAPLLQRVERDERELVQASGVRAMEKVCQEPSGGVPPSGTTSAKRLLKGPLKR